MWLIKDSTHVLERRRSRIESPHRPYKLKRQRVVRLVILSSGPAVPEGQQPRVR
jgi:hypothetical protein